MNTKSIKLISTISFVGLLSACAGGGGGGGSSSSSSGSGGSGSYWVTSDVKAAWAEGYTGKGVVVNNIDYTPHTNPDGSSHASSTSQIISAIAPDATVANTSITGWTNAMMDAIAGSNARVINLSIGTGGTTSSSPSFYSGTTNAVITKAAGNSGNGVTADQELSNKMLWNSNMQNNTIYVGAIDAKTGNIASYSTAAGAYASRFVVADGQGPTYQGTSYSAPVVAGYAALITQKFPNSTGAQIAQAILDTAIMKPGWDPAVYGRGQANLAGALSPQGKLK